MNPIDFPQAIISLGAPAGADDVTPLRVWTDGREVISCWMPTEEERIRVAAGEPIYLRSLSGCTQFPVCLEVGSPFTDDGIQESDAEVLRAAGIDPT